MYVFIINSSTVNDLVRSLPLASRNIIGLMLFHCKQHDVSGLECLSKMIINRNEVQGIERLVIIYRTDVINLFFGASRRTRIRYTLCMWGFIVIVLLLRCYLILFDKYIAQNCYETKSSTTFNR